MSLLSNVTKLARGSSKHGRSGHGGGSMVDKARRYATSPEGRRQLQTLRTRFGSKRR